MIRFEPPLPDAPGHYADFITHCLLRPLSPHGARAVAETEHPLDGDDWFWADDNAKVLEFLALPDVWRGRERAVGEILDFLRGMCDGPFIFRRVALPRLQQLANQDGRASFIHSLLHIACDLPRGVVEVGCRFHDGRDGRHVTLTGNYVQFRHAGRSHSLDVEDAIVAWDVAQEQGTLLLAHASELYFEADGRRRLGRLTYRYRFDAASALFDAEATLELDAAIAVENLVLTFGHDNLSHRENGVHYRHVAAVRDGVETVRLAAEQPAQRLLAVPGAEYWQIAQEDMMGFALGIHSLPREPARMTSIDVVTLRQGDLHWVGSRHVFPGAHRGGTLYAAETKTVTAGGLYRRTADYAALLHRHAARAAPAPMALDLSISYDYGAEISCFARLYRTLASGDAPFEDPALKTQLRTLFDSYVEVYRDNLVAAHHAQPGAIFSRPLSFLICGLADMHLATGAAEYLVALRAMLEVLLAFEKPFPGPDGAMESGFLMGLQTASAPFVDCHAAALLALVRAAPLLDDPRIPGLVERGLAAFRVATMAVELGVRRKGDLVTVGLDDQDGRPSGQHAFWNFGAALSLRAFNALARSEYPPLQQVHLRHRSRIALFDAMLRAQIGRSLRERPEGIEIRTSEHSAEGNSETQPWAALAIVREPRDA